MPSREIYAIDVPGWVRGAWVCTWLLCTENAHARSSGSCVRVATMTPLRVMFQLSGCIAAVVPFEKRTTGTLPAATHEQTRAARGGAMELT